MGRTLGIILIVGGIAAAVVLALVLGVFASEGTTGRSGAVLGFAIGFFVIVLPMIGFGGFMLWRGGKEAESAAEAEKQRSLLNIVKTRGQVAVSDLAIELKSSRDEVNHMLNELVGMGLFSGYVNWDEGMLYSEQASELHALTNCRNCGGELNLAGKGVIRCPFCGTEYFLDR